MAENSIESLTPTGAINAIKGITRLYQYQLSQEFQKLKQDPRYMALVNKVKQNIDSLTQTDIQELLFIARKFSNFESYSGFSFVEIEKFKQMILRDMQNDQIPPKSLIHAHFNLSSINFDTYQISSYLLKKIRENPAILNSFHYSYLITSISIKMNTSSQADFSLAEECVKIIVNYIEEFDNSKKCEIFKHAASLELHLNGSNMQVPHLLYKLKNTIKECLDKLSEIDILNIVEAHTYLPPQFSNDLLNEFKSMVVVTLQHNPNNLKTNFLINLMKIQNKLTRSRRINAEGIKLIIQTLVQRFKTEHIISNNLPVILKSMRMNKLTSDTLAKECIKYLEDNPDTKREKEVNMVEYLIEQDLQVHSHIEKIVKSRAEVPNSVNVFRRLAHALRTKENPEYQNSIDLLESQPHYSNELALSPASLKGTFSDSDHVTSLMILEKTFSKMVGVGEEVELNNNQLEIIIQSTVNYESINTILRNDTYRSILSSLSTQRINSLLVRMTELDQPNTHQFHFLLKVLQLNRSKVQIKKILWFFNIMGEELINLTRRNESLGLRYINFLVKLEEVTNPNNIYTLFNLINRFNEYNLTNEILNSSLLKCYLKNKTEGKVVRLNLEVEIAKVLMKEDTLPVEIAIELMEKIKDKQRFNNYESEHAILCYILRSRKIQNDQRKPFEDAAKAKISELVTKLNELDPKTAIQAFRELISFPPELIEEQAAKLVESLNDHMVTMNSRTICDILSSFPPQRLNRNFEFYFPLIKTLFNGISNMLDKLRPTNFIDILEIGASIGYRNPSFYNKILSEISSTFYTFKNSDLISIIISFSTLGHNQTDLFDKIFTRLIQDSSSLTNQQRMKILSSFYLIGYNSTLLKSKILTFVNQRVHTNGISRPRSPSVINPRPVHPHPQLRKRKHLAQPDL